MSAIFLASQSLMLFSWFHYLSLFFAYMDLVDDSKNCCYFKRVATWPLLLFSSFSLCICYMVTGFWLCINISLILARILVTWRENIFHTLTAQQVPVTQWTTREASGDPFLHTRRQTTTRVQRCFSQKDRTGQCWQPGWSPGWIHHWLRPGAIAQSPGREAALAWASLAQSFPASSVLAR